MSRASFGISMLSSMYAPCKTLAESFYRNYIQGEPRTWQFAGLKQKIFYRGPGAVVAVGVVVSRSRGTSTGASDVDAQDEYRDIYVRDAALLQIPDELLKVAHAGTHLIRHRLYRDDLYASIDPAILIFALLRSTTLLVLVKPSPARWADRRACQEVCTATAQRTRAPCVASLRQYTTAPVHTP